MTNASIKRQWMANVTPAQQSIAAHLAPRLSLLSTPLPAMIDPIDVVASLLVADAAHARQARLSPAAFQDDVKSWKAAFGSELRSLGHRSPDSTASHAVHTAIHLHCMPENVGRRSLLELAAKAFPRLSWYHLTRLIPHTLRLAPEPPPGYPLTAGPPDWERRQAERAKHDFNELHRLFQYARRNEQRVMSWLEVADRDCLSPKQLEHELSKIGLSATRS